MDTVTPPPWEQQVADADLAQVIRAWRDNPPDVQATAQQRRQARAQVTAALPAGPELAQVVQLQIPGNATVAPIAARLYRATRDFAPLALYFHGGGWVTGGLDSHDRPCRRLAAAIGLNVLAVDYRLAPEHPWPAALDDCVRALTWVQDHLPQLHNSGHAIGVVGDSSGAHLAALTCQQAQANGLPQPAWQALAYPNIDPTLEQLESPLSQAYRDGWVLRSADVAWFAQQTFPDPALRVAANALRGDLGGLPPAVIVTCELDPLRCEGHAYAQALQHAGVKVHYREEPGMIHGFLLGHDARSPAAYAAGERFFADLGRLAAS